MADNRAVMGYIVVNDSTALDYREIAKAIGQAAGRTVRVFSSRPIREIGVLNARLSNAAAAGALVTTVEFAPVIDALTEDEISAHAMQRWGEAPGVPDTMDEEIAALALKVLTGELTFPDPEDQRRNVTRAAVNPGMPVISLPGGLEGLNDPIPRIIHMAWLGKKPLTDLNRRCIDSWIEHHPDWAISIWCDEASESQLKGYRHQKVFEPLLITGNLYQAAANLGEATDILRLELLRQYGGVWVDCDMECFRPIDDLVTSGFVTSMGPHGSYMQLENAIMGACLGHPIVEAMVRALPLWTAVFPDAAVIYRAGPVYVDYWCRGWMGHAFGAQKSKEPVSANSVTVLPMEWFFHPCGREAALRDGSYGYHHGTGSWINP